MRFRVNDSLKRVFVVSELDGITNRIEVACVVARPGDGAPDRMDECSIPLCVEPCAAGRSGLGKPLILLQVFCDRKFPRLALVFLIVDLLHQAPTIADVVGRIIVAMDVSYPSGGIPA